MEDTPSEKKLWKNGEQYRIERDPYGRFNDEKRRETGLILDIYKGKRVAFLYNGRVYVLPFAFLCFSAELELRRGIWIAFNFVEPEQWKTISDVINPTTSYFPVEIMEDNQMRLTINVVKRDIWVYPHKEVYVKMENGQYERRPRYPDRIWSPELGFIPDPYNIFYQRKGEKAVRVLTSVEFDWKSFEDDRGGPFYCDVSQHLQVEPLEILGYSEEREIVLYTPWQIAANREYKRTNFGPRQPERLFLNRVNDKSRYFGLVIDDEQDHIKIYNYRLGHLRSPKRYAVVPGQAANSIIRAYKPSPPIGSFVMYGVAQSLDNYRNFEAARVDICRLVYDVKILILDKKPTPLLALDIILPIDFAKCHTIYHPFCGPVLVYYYQMEKELKRTRPDLTMKDLLGREIRIWVKLLDYVQETKDPWMTEFWRFEELDYNLFNDRACRM